MGAQQQNLNAPERILEFNLYKELNHGILVSNLAYDLGKELEMEEEQCYELAVAGLLHDIGKLKLIGYIDGTDNDQLIIEEVKYVRMHSQLGYEVLKEQGYSEFILDSVHYHHENYDGSGYPSNLSGENIPIGARIIRVCDMFAAIRAERPFSRALDTDEAMQTMIDEIRYFDMRVFLALQNVVHRKDYRPQEILHI